MSEPLLQFGPEIWIADGPVASFYGFPYPARMAVVRLFDGSLFVWSPVALSGSLRASIDVLGPVRCLVSPNALHHLFLAEWKSAYPEARLYASPRLRGKRKDLAFDVMLAGVPEPEWAADIEQVVLHGSFYLTEVVFFHRHSHTALFAEHTRRRKRCRLVDGDNSCVGVWRAHDHGMRQRADGHRRRCCLCRSGDKNPACAEPADQCRSPRHPTQVGRATKP